MRELEQGRKSAPVKTAVKKDVKTEKEKAKETAKEKETAKAKRPSAGGAASVPGEQKMRWVPAPAYSI